MGAIGGLQPSLALLAPRGGHENNFAYDTGGQPNIKLITNIHGSDELFSSKMELLEGLHAEEFMNICNRGVIMIDHSHLFILNHMKYKIIISIRYEICYIKLRFVAGQQLGGKPDV